MNTSFKKIILAASLSIIASSAFAEKIILKYGHVGKPGVNAGPITAFGETPGKPGFDRQPFQPLDSRKNR